MEKFTIISPAHGDKFHFTFDDMLRIVGYTYNKPFTMLRQLDRGDITEIKLPAGKLVKFVLPGKNIKGEKPTKGDLKKQTKRNQKKQH